MPEIRKDPTTGHWIIVATERARRPGVFVNPQKNTFEDSKECPFCNVEGTEIYSQKSDNPQRDGARWRVKVVSSGTPLLSPSRKGKRHGHGLYDVAKGYGVHEVVIETPKHIANMADLDADQICVVLETYALRFKELEKNTEFQYALAYKNYGWAAGSRRIGHSRSQIMATPSNPFSVKEKLREAKRYYDYHDRCLYCDLIGQEGRENKRVIFETEHFVAVTPFAPRFLFETWILPKEHHCDFAHGVSGKEQDLAVMLKEILLKIKVGIEDPAYNYVIQSAPFRREKKGKRWRTINEDYHWHIQVIPRLTQAAGFEKGTGFHMCSIPPEHAAEFLREVKV